MWPMARILAPMPETWPEFSSLAAQSANFEYNWLNFKFRNPAQNSSSNSGILVRTLAPQPLQAQILNVTGCIQIPESWPEFWLQFQNPGWNSRIPSPWLLKAQISNLTVYIQIPGSWSEFRLQFQNLGWNSGILPPQPLQAQILNVIVYVPLLESSPEVQLQFQNPSWYSLQPRPRSKRKF